MLGGLVRTFLVTWYMRKFIGILTTLFLTKFIDVNAYYYIYSHLYSICVGALLLNAEAL